MNKQTKTEKNQRGVITMGFLISLAVATISAVQIANNTQLTVSFESDLGNKVKQFRDRSKNLQKMAEESDSIIMQAFYVRRAQEVSEFAEVLNKRGRVIVGEGIDQVLSDVAQQAITGPTIGRFEITKDLSYDDTLGIMQIAWSGRSDVRRETEKLTESERAFYSTLGQRFRRGEDIFQDILTDLLRASYEWHYTSDYRNAANPVSLEEVYNLARQDVQKIINKMPEKTRTSGAFREASQNFGFEYDAQETTKPTPAKPQKTVSDCDREYDSCAEAYYRVQDEIEANNKAAVKAGHSIEDEPWVSNWEFLMQKLESTGEACTVQFDACCVEIGLYPSKNTGVCRYKP